MVADTISRLQRFLARHSCMFPTNLFLIYNTLLLLSMSEPGKEIPILGNSCSNFMTPQPDVPASTDKTTAAYPKPSSTGKKWLWWCHNRRAMDFLLFHMFLDKRPGLNPSHFSTCNPQLIYKRNSRQGPGWKIAAILWHGARLYYTSFLPMALPA